MPDTLKMIECKIKLPIGIETDLKSFSFKSKELFRLNSENILYMADKIHHLTLFHDNFKITFSSYNIVDIIHFGDTNKIVIPIRIKISFF